MTLGDVLAVLAAVFIVGTSWAAAILLAALAFPARTARAQEQLMLSPGRCALRGLGALAAGGLLAALLLNGGPGPVKLLGGLVVGGLGVLAALGSAAMVRLLATRIDALGSPMTPFAGLTRASVLYVSAGFLPVIGWFFLVPAALLLSVGSSVAVLRGEKQAAPKPIVYEAPAASLETLA